MIAPMELPGFGKATRCDAAAFHAPKPLRYVWHHILPQEAGGLTKIDNLVQVCDSCHYGIHTILWFLATHNGQFGINFYHYMNAKRGHIALQGYLAAEAAGTLDRIPKEG